MYYPLIFEPLYKDYIWGGRKLETLGKKLPLGNVAESWEIASHPAGSGIISNGEFKGRALDKLVAQFGTEILGKSIFKDTNTKFPLLIKLIDANSDLSVQVHPNDVYACEMENGELGKSEMWYIVDAVPGSKLVSGVKNGTTKEKLIRAIKDGKVSECLNYVNVKPGDCFNIPAGLVHAIGAGCLICEIQQNSNTTYRVYDYDRTDAKGNKRPLHIEKALDVIDFSAGEGKSTLGLKVELKNQTRIYLVANQYFSVELIDFSGVLTEDTKGERFHCYTVLKGSISINGQEIKKGHSCLIPASAGLYSISGTATLIKAYVPDLEKDVYTPLLENGHSLTEINSIIR